MDKLKKLISVFCAALIILSVPCTVNAYDEKSNGDINNIKYVTPVKTGTQDKCVSYALLDTAESYCIRNLGISAEEAVFDEKAFTQKTGDSANFGEVLYSAADFSLGNGCYITGIQSLTGKGDRLIKEKIKENGAVIAAIRLPEGGMTDVNYYRIRENGDAAFYFPDTGKIGEKNHAFSVVGWDDDYSAENFANNPGADGAWLCKNNYGTSFGKNGYFYLSYACPFLYASAIEVSRFSNVKTIKKADKAALSLKKTAAVGIRSNENLGEAGIEVIFNDRDTVSLTCPIKEGYNFVSLGNEGKYGAVKVRINGQEISSSSVNCYKVKGKDNTLTASAPQTDVSWTEECESAAISLSKGDYRASSPAGGKEITHKVRLNSTDNFFTVTPCDGTYFSESTRITLTMEVMGEDGARNVTKEGTVNELCGQNVNISLTDDGKLKIKSKTTGGAFKSGVDIITDDESRITAVYLIEDNGSRQILPEDEYSVTLHKSAVRSSFSTDEHGEEAESIKGLEFYYAVIEIEGYLITEDFGVFLNGNELTADAGFSFEGNTLTVGAVIDIPQVTFTIGEIISAGLFSISKFLSIILNSINKG